MAASISEPDPYRLVKIRVRVVLDRTVFAPHSVVMVLHSRPQPRDLRVAGVEGVGGAASGYAERAYGMGSLFGPPQLFLRDYVRSLIVTHDLLLRSGIWGRPSPAGL
jgi:hypothetical protein